MSRTNLFLAVLTLSAVLVTLPGYAQIFTDDAAARGVSDTAAAQGPVFGDYDNDGDEDMVLCVDVGGAARLFVNNGSGVFTEDTSQFTTADIAESNAACWFDYDKDGDLDIIFGAVYMPTELFENNGDGTFTNVSSILSATDEDFDNAFAVGIGDFDQNGDADVAIAIFSTYEGPNPMYFNTAGTFVEGGTSPFSTELVSPRTINVIDFDNDGDLDIYLNHTQGDSVLYRNDGGNVWTEVANGTPIECAGRAGRGSAWGDLDMDGDLDCVIAVGDADNVIARNDGGGTFTAITGTPVNTGIAAAICPVLFDYDNDGDLDVFIHTLLGAGGPAALYRNDGGFTFTDVTATDAPTFSTDLVDGRGAAVADIDNDGDLDLYRGGGGAGQPSYLYINQTNNSNWLKVKVVGTISDPQAFGAEVSVYQAGTSTLVGYSQVQSQSGYESFNSLIQHFGVPAAGTYDVQVYFPTSGITMYQSGVSATQMLTFVESAGPTPTPTETPIVAEVGNTWKDYR